MGGSPLLVWWRATEAQEKKDQTSSCPYSRMSLYFSISDSMKD